MKIGAIVPLAAAVHPDAAFADVDGDPVLARVVRALLGPDCAPASGAVVAAAEPLAAAARSCLDSSGLSAVTVVASGTDDSRRACLIAGLKHLGGEPHSPSHILIGDHRQALASTEVAARVIARLRAGHPVVVPVLPLTDTVKAVDGRGAVVGTPDRAALRTVQYPRGYRRSVLEALLAEDPDELTVALSADLPVATVDGDADGFAAELPADVELLDAITAARRRLG